MRSHKSSLVFAYNADSGMISAVLDSAHRLLAPQACACSLCALTFSAFSMHRRWKEYLDSLGMPVEFYHRDELPAGCAGQGAVLPAVFLRSGNTFAQLISAAEIQACPSLDDLIALVRRALGSQSPGPAALRSSSPHQLDVLFDLARFLLPGAAFLTAKIELAAYHPEDYLRALGPDGRYEKENLFPAALPWQVLIRGLEQDGRLVAINWQLPPADVLVQLGRLLPAQLAQQAWTWWDLDSWRRRPTFDFLDALARRLGTPHRCLAWFPLEGDTYPVLLSTPVELEQASLMAARSGFGQIAPLAPVPRARKSSLIPRRTGL